MFDRQMLLVQVILCGQCYQILLNVNGSPKLLGLHLHMLILEIFAEMTLPLPPYREQLRIVAEVERRLSVVQEMEGMMEANLRRAGRLRQAVLKRAFEGRLT